MPFARTLKGCLDASLCESICCCMYIYIMQHFGKSDKAVMVLETNPRTATPQDLCVEFKQPRLTTPSLPR